MNVKQAIATVIEGQSLSMDEAAQVMDEIMSGEATPAQIGALMVGLRMRGETAEEVAGFARTMRAKATPVQVSAPVVDTAGTGGDGAGTFNISTAACIVAAAAGVPVAKHGNRAFSSRCGSADVLESLGVRIDLKPEQVASCIERIGIGFMFAPLFHPALRHAMGPRQELGIRSIFNILGPLSNPAGAPYQVMGVANAQLAPLMADVLRHLGCSRALVVHGDGLDEVSVSGPTTVYHVEEQTIRSYQISPEQYGLARAPVESVRGGTAEENARIVRSVLSGDPGPRRDVVLLNAAAALIAGGAAAEFADGIRVAAQTIDSGAARGKLDALVRTSQELAAV
ncbi:MAG: anthranilate phosphoribosyltransferase [Chloroflexota bacterium]|nr:MAG: anthranilate phosphoribosyltransferase [Chloroflexota bacterium]